VLPDIDCKENQGVVVLNGTAPVIAPEASIVWPRLLDAEISVHRHDRHEHFVRASRSLSPLRTTIVHPCSPEALHAAIEARERGCPIRFLSGPKERSAKPLMQPAWV
jgi:phosphate acetyltransferase